MPRNTDAQLARARLNGALELTHALIARAQAAHLQAHDSILRAEALRADWRVRRRAHPARETSAALSAVERLLAKARFLRLNGVTPLASGAPDAPPGRILQFRRRVAKKRS